MKFETYADYAEYVVGKMAKEQGKTPVETVLSLVKQTCDQDDLVRDILTMMMEYDLDSISEIIDEYAEDHDLEEFFED